LSSDLPESDRVLWARVSADDSDAFSVIFDRHAGAIFRYALRRCSDWSMAEDVVATTFLEAWRKRRATLTIEESITPWLFGVATNVLRNLTRSRRRYESALERLAGTRPTDGDSEEAVVARVDADLAASALAKAISGVPRRQQDVIWLCMVEGLSHREAATALGVPSGTIKSRLSRAGATLRANPSLEPFWSSGHDIDEVPDVIKESVCETD
jgi:RNA polymerase sigma-70 factor (ECF subfamily)